MRPTLCLLKYVLSTSNVAVVFYPSVNSFARIGICLLMMVRRQALSKAE